MEHILANGNIKHKFAVRIQTVLYRANGKKTNDIACFLGIHPVTVSGYVKRYNSGGIEALVRDKTRKPGKVSISDYGKTGFAKPRVLKNRSRRHTGVPGSLPNNSA
ncbi:MAG: helix-turn-helix domain containing protein [Treponema sp.]|nr:helix-turn-helix domain containing protein [Treponema sp.]